MCKINSQNLKIQHQASKPCQHLQNPLQTQAQTEIQAQLKATKTILLPPHWGLQALAASVSHPYDSSLPSSIAQPRDHSPASVFPNTSLWPLLNQ